jgi:anti-sigma regulatory factor (Ser/Thr protein kinase)
MTENGTMDEQTLKRGPPEIDMELSIPLSPLAPRAARVVLTEVIDVSEPALSVAQLLLSEVLSNSVSESRLAPNSPIRVRVSTDPSTIRVDVDDAGFDFVLPPSPGELSEKSRALYLVSYLADRWGVERVRNTTRVWFEIRLT